MDIIMMRENEASLAVTDRGKAELETRSEKLDTQALALRGAVLVLIQFDVCEEIKLDQLRQIFGARTLEQPSFKHPTPGYVRYQRPPVVEPIEPLILETGERLEGQIKYYDYGVLSVVFELPFSGDWDTLVRLGSRWVWDIDCVEDCAPETGAGAAGAGETVSGVAERRLFYFPCARNYRVAKRQRSCSHAGRTHRADCSRRNCGAVRWRAQRDPAVTHFLLSK